MPEKELIPGFFINKTSMKIKNCLNMLLQPYEITAEQLVLLRLIEYRQKINQREIVDSICKEKTNVARIAERLEKKELIVRDRDNIDKRANILSLTPKGRETLSMLLPVVKEYSDKIFSGIPKDELDSAIKTLTQIYNNIDRTF